MKQALIVAGGRIETEFCREYMDRHVFDLMAAADSGMQFFFDINTKPDLIAGDFDSVNEETLRFFEGQGGIRWVRLNPVKDDTDTEALLQLLIKEGYNKIHVLGATGSRADHMLGNIGLLGLGLLYGVGICLADSHNRIRMINDTLFISKDGQFGNYISLLPVTREVRGVTLSGMKYPLKDYTMERYHTLGISNEIVEEEACIRLKEGALLVIEARD